MEIGKFAIDAVDCVVNAIDNPDEQEGVQRHTCPTMTGSKLVSPAKNASPAAGDRLGVGPEYIEVPLPITPRQAVAVLHVHLTVKPLTPKSLTFGDEDAEELKRRNATEEASQILDVNAPERVRS